MLESKVQTWKKKEKEKRTNERKIGEDYLLLFIRRNYNKNSTPFGKMEWKEDVGQLRERNGELVVDIAVAAPPPFHCKYFTPFYFIGMRTPFS